MTREENLHWLNQEIQTWENECQSKHPIKEALYAARKALEQEPTTKNNRGVDCSLDDFIKYCKRTFGVELTVKKSDNPDTYAKLFGTTKNDLGVDCVYGALDIIDKYQTIQKIVKSWEDDTWTNGHSYDCMIMISEVLKREIHYKPDIVKPYLEAIEAEAIKYSGTGEGEIQAYGEGLFKAIEIIKKLLSEQEVKK